MQPISFYDCQKDWPGQQNLPLSKFDESGPFDIIGDVHGCYHELCQLLTKLGYRVDPDHWQAEPPAGRCLIFLGDLCDRGPNNLDVLRLAVNLESQGLALFVTGNHDEALWLRLHQEPAPGILGIEPTLLEIEVLPDMSPLRTQISNLLEKGASYYVLDQGRLVVVHAGLIEYEGEALVVYGHTAFKQVQRSDHSICIDTGCVFGNQLTALRYPENEIVSVPARQMYFRPLQELK